MPASTPEHREAGQNHRQPQRCADAVLEHLARRADVNRRDGKVPDRGERPLFQAVAVELGGRQDRDAGRNDEHLRMDQKRHAVLGEECQQGRVADNRRRRRIGERAAPQRQEQVQHADDKQRRRILQVGADQPEAQHGQHRQERGRVLEWLGQHVDLEPSRTPPRFPSPRTQCPSRRAASTAATGRGRTAGS